MKIVTYNINSIKARCANFCNWLREHNPDIVFLQEIKCDTADFTYFEFESLGYYVAVHGQKGYNGVAVLSKFPFDITSKNLPNFNDDINARYIEVLVHAPNLNFYAASVYAPNGCSNDKSSEKIKLTYKLEWFDKLYEHIKSLREKGKSIILGGDFNVMLQDIDVYDPDKFKCSPLYISQVRDKITALKHIGLYDTFRLLYPESEGYTFWDYTANSLVTNSGLRIDYLFITARLAERLIDCKPDKALRTINKPSDHTVLVAEFEE